MDRFADHALGVVEALLYISNWTGAFQLWTATTMIHTWSLSVEEQFYLAWPVILAILLRWPRGRTLALSAAFLLAAAAIVWRTHLALNGASLLRLNFAFDTRCDALFIGCALAFIGHRVSLLWPLGVAGIVLALYQPGMGVPVGAIHYTLVAVSAALMIAGAIRQDTYLARALSFAPLVAIGQVSYGLYLFHTPIFSIIYIQAGGYRPWYFAILGLTLTFAFAILSYRYVERPLLDRRYDTSLQYLAFLGPACVAIGVVYLVCRLV
jgi:peptidoglycan/LPS O-acetylase OafA/YrhL